MECPYVYQALTPPHSIRLLRLLPDPNADGPLHGSLFECNIDDFYGHPNAYEALSYVWGDPTLSHSISIDGFKLPITANLHTALANLRSLYIERLLWVDAMCIDQTNDREKEWQIGLMYQIYACASCVVVWLGEHEDGSEHICEDLLFIRTKEPAHDQVQSLLSDRIMRFFQRAWFRRIWVLQEVGAARRVQIRWGNSTMDGFAFSEAATFLFSRLRKVDEASEESQKKQSVAHFISWLIQGSSFRMPYQGRNGPPDGVCGFAELIDMFHKAEASKIHDKVYALLAMSMEDMGASGLLPDYTIPFGRLLKRVVSVLISDKMSVKCQDSMDAVLIKTTGHVLGTIQKVRDDLQSPQLQKIDVKLFSITDHPPDSFISSADEGGEYNRRSLYRQWYIQGSAIPVHEGDVMCYLDGAARPTIIRLCQDYSMIIIAAVSWKDIELSDSEERLGWQNHTDDWSLPKRVFYLVWDWTYSSSSHFENYAAWAQSRAWVSDSMSATQNTDVLAHRYDCALICADANGIESSKDRFREVLADFESMLQSNEPHTRSRQAFSAFLDRLYGRDVIMAGQEPDKNCTKKEHIFQCISELCCWAAEECCKNVTGLLIEAADFDGINTSECLIVSSVARAGFLDLIKLVLEEKTNPTHPLWKVSDALESAIIGGHLPIIEYLLEVAHTREVDIAPIMESALVLAAEQGHLAVVERLLLPAANSKEYQIVKYIYLAQSKAAQGSHLAVYQRLLQAEANANVPGPGVIRIGWDRFRASLMEAARVGRVTWLFLNDYSAAGAGDCSIGGVTMHRLLAVAVSGGHLPVVKRLVQAGADVNGNRFESRSDGDPTPLKAAAIAGHLSVFMWLLEAGADPTRLRKVKLVAYTVQELAIKNGHFAIAEKLHKVSGANNDNRRRSRMEFTRDTSSSEKSSSRDESRSLAIKKHFGRIKH